MAINKIAIDGTPLIDLSTDTVASAEDIALGKVGHLNDGTVVTGTHQGGSDPVIQPLSVTENGTYTAPEGIDGYSPVNVSVPDTGKNGLYLATILRTVTEFVDESITYTVSRMFEYQPKITRISLPNALFDDSSYLCRGATQLKVVDMPKYDIQGRTSGGNRVFSGCSNLAYVRCGRSGDSYEVFDSCSKLKTLFFTRYSFGGMRNLSLSASPSLLTLVLNTLTVPPMDNISIFNANSPIMQGTGSVYVPDFDNDGNDLPAQYKVATNWSALPEGVIKGFSEAPAFTSGVHTIGDFVKFNGKAYTYWDYNDTANEPSGTTADNDWWHYVGECEAI